MADLNSIADQLSGLTVMEAAELATLLEDKWGVSAAAPVAVAATDAPAAAAEEQTEFDVILISQGDKKIQVIKEVRAITGLGLMTYASPTEELQYLLELGTASLTQGEFPVGQIDTADLLLRWLS